MEKMSWLSKLNPRASSTVHRASPRGSNLQSPVRADPETCLMVFKNHWAQVLRILEKPSSSSSSSSSRGAPGAADDLSAVRNNTYQMMTLLLEEQPRGEGGSAMGPILEFVVSEEVLGRLLAWHMARGVPEDRQAELLKLFEMLVSQARQPLLRHKPLVAPLQRLLAHCAGVVGGAASPHLEGSLVLLLHQLCASVAKEPPLLELFFHSPPQGPPELLIFSLLVPFVHHEGGIGQQARDALLLLMAMSAGSPTLARYITEHSYFCPVLATGLSALYSSLPRKLEVHGDDWHFLRREDWTGLPSLALFMNSLEFCNAVVQVAHPLVQKQLVGYVHNGFLVPVMGPALHKSSIEEMIASTAYLELFLRSLSEAPLLKIFLRFLLLHHHDGSTILDTLVGRIASNSRLCMVSLGLFRTLLNLHCEDVLLQLVLRGVQTMACGLDLAPDPNSSKTQSPHSQKQKYLVPCSHVMLSQKRAVKEVDLYGKAAGKFLSLVPRCCLRCPPEGLTLSPPTEHQEEEEQQQQHAAWSKGHGSPSVDTSSVVTVPRPSTPSRLSFFMRQPSFSAEASSPTHRSPGTPPADSPYHHASRGEELSELEGNYLEYLRDARLNVDRCVWACRVWSAPYDGELPGAASLAPMPDPTSGLPGNKDLRPAPPSPRTKKRGLPVEEEAAGPTGPPAVGSETGLPISPGPMDSGALLNGVLVDTGGVKKVRRCKGPGEGVENGTGPAMPSPPTSWQPSPCSDPLLEELLAQAAVENGTASTVERFAAELSQLEQEMENGGGEEVAPLERDPCSPEEDEEADRMFSRPDGTGQARPFADPLTQVISSPPRPPGQPPSQPFTGPFVGVLLSKLENMPQNSLYVNLLLTGLLAHLACHPQPLLRSFLLNTNMVFQPSIKSLLQVLGSVKNKIESFAASQEDFPALLFRAKKYLIARGKMVDGSEVQNAAAPALRRSETLVKSRKPSLGELILRHTNSPTRARQAAQLALQHMREGPVLQALSGGGVGGPSSLFRSSSPPSAKNQNEALRVKNAVYCAVIFTEFLKELAAIAQAQAVTSPFLLLLEVPPKSD